MDEESGAPSNDVRGLIPERSRALVLVGRDFGVITDIKTGPNGNLFVVSLDRGSNNGFSVSPAPDAPPQVFTIDSDASDQVEALRMFLWAFKKSSAS